VVRCDIYILGPDNEGGFKLYKRLRTSWRGPDRSTDYLRESLTFVQTPSHFDELFFELPSVHKYILQSNSTQ
jgi:hypothetical protein